MPNTPIWLIPYAGPTDAPNGYGQEQSIAQAVEAALNKVTGPLASGRLWVSGRGSSNPSDSFGGGSFVPLMGVNLASTAPAGAYTVSVIFDLGATTTTTGNLRVTAPNGANLSGDKAINPITAGYRTPISFTSGFLWTGGAGQVLVSVQLGSAGSVFNPGANVTVSYLGA